MSLFMAAYIGALLSGVVVTPRLAEICGMEMAQLRTTVSSPSQHNPMRGVVLHLITWLSAALTLAAAGCAYVESGADALIGGIVLVAICMFVIILILLAYKKGLSRVRSTATHY